MENKGEKKGRNWVMATKKTVRVFSLISPLFPNHPLWLKKNPEMTQTTVVMTQRQKINIVED